MAKHKKKSGTGGKGAKGAKGGKNKYAQKAKQASFMNLHQQLQTKGDAKNTAIETAKDVVIGVVGGGLVGAAVGKPSLIVGLGLTGAGHYMGIPLLRLLGIGMMAANGFQRSQTVNGLDGMSKAEILNRIKAYKENFTEKLYLDKLRKNSGGGEAANGVGELQFFNYPNDVNGAYDELAALDNLEQQILQSGMNQMEGMEGMEGIGEFGELALVEASDLNL